MNVHHTGSSVRIAALCAILAGGLCMDLRGQVSDDFNRCAFDTARWTWVNPLGDCTYQISGAGTGSARLEIAVPAGKDHDLWSAGNKAPRMVQAAANNDFELEAKFESIPSRQYQIEGILVQQDARNYLRFDFYHDGTSLRIFSTCFTNDVPRRPIPLTTTLSMTSPPLFLRVKRAGNSWTVSYSTSGTSWTAAATYSHTLVVTGVGVYASNAGTAAPAFTGLIDYFFNTAAPIAPEDGNLAGSFTVQAAVAGNGTVTQTPAKAHYCPGEAVRLEATASNGWIFAGWSGDASGSTNPLDITVQGNVSVTATFEQPGVPPGIRSDDFDRCAFDDALWDFVNPLGDGSYRLSGAGTGDARLEISVPAGTDHDLWTAGNKAPRIIQAVPDVDFTVEAKFDSIPSRKYQIQGILVQQNPATYLRCDFVHNGSTLQIFSAYLANDVPSRPVPLSKSLAITSAPLYLRLARVANSWTVSYSTTGTSWTAAATFSCALAVTAVGVYASNAGTSAPAFVGLVDYFFTAAAPIAPEDGAIAGTLPLALATEGSGTIQATPAKAAYCPGDVVMLQAIPDPGWTFTGWSGSASGVENPLAFTIEAASAVTATFEQTSTPLLVSDVSIDVTEATATVTWNTDQPTTGAVAYRLPGAAYGSPVSDGSELTASHGVVLLGLTPETTYEYRITAENEAGDQATVEGVFTTAHAGVVSDDFNAFDLDGNRWKLVDPRGDALLAMTGANTSDAAFTLAVPSTASHDVWREGNFSARIMQPAPNEDFIAEAKFLSRPAVKYQLEGILVEQDPQRFIRFDFYSDGAGLRIFIASFSSPVPPSTLLQVVIHYDKAISVPVGSPLFLRLERSGASWNAFYSGDGANWTAIIPAPTIPALSTLTRVGVYAGNHYPRAGSPPPAFTALVDYFAVEPAEAERDAFVAAEDAATVTDTLGPFLYHERVLPLVNGENADIDAIVQTDEVAEAFLDYGLTPSYELGTVPGAAPGLSHHLVAPNLSVNVAYHVRLRVRDALGNTSLAASIVHTGSSGGPLINVWYGNSQRFGDFGIPQRWINILGNVSDPDGIAALYSSLNGAPESRLTVKDPADIPPNPRLAAIGDFNAEIALDNPNLREGDNTLILRAVDRSGAQSMTSVLIHMTTQNAWPLPYDIAWNTAARIQDVAQPVDGLWELTAGGVHTIQPWYDRLIAIGDRTWSNYEVTVPITIHAIDETNGDPPPSNGPAVGILVLWPGHTPDSKQPTLNYTPFGAAGFFRWNAGGSDALELYQYRSTDGATLILYPEPSPTVTIGGTYVFKMRVTMVEETIGGVVQRKPFYQLKMWEQGVQEPADWILKNMGVAGDPVQGSLLLLAHHVDATFGTVHVTAP
jgi:uncharacterized repeat protein (TIGR02543 family)